MKSLINSGIAATLLAVLAQPAFAFNTPEWCAKAKTPVEKLVCADAELSESAIKLDKVWDDYKSSHDDAAITDVRVWLRSWNKDTFQACQDRACIASAYETTFAYKPFAAETEAEASAQPDESDQTREQMLEKWKQKAIKGGFWDWNNYAYALTGSDATSSEKLLACAWYSAILFSGDDHMSESIDKQLQQSKVDNACGKLDEIQRRNAANKAAEILEIIAPQ